MSGNVSQLNTHATTAASAVADGNYGAAIVAALQAKILLAVMPNLERSAAGNAQRMGWSNVQAIDSFIRECRQLQTAANVTSGGPLQQSKIVYARPTSVDDY